jgi:hypothetical protein
MSSVGSRTKVLVPREERVGNDVSARIRQKKNEEWDPIVLQSCHQMLVKC